MGGAGNVLHLEPDGADLQIDEGVRGVRLESVAIGLFGGGKTLGVNIFNEYTQLQIDLIAIERKAVERLHHEGKVSEEILRKIEKELAAMFSSLSAMRRPSVLSTAS